ncbi:MAG: O-antigen ligase family protein [Patescibacteria group bacterium]
MNYFKISKFFLYLVPFSVIIVSTGTLFPFIVGKYVFFRTAVGLALLFYLIGWLFQKNFQFSIFNFQLLKSPLVIAVAVFTAIFLLACLFSYNPSASFWSNFERGEGGLQILCLFIFFILLSLLFKKQDDWHRLFKISLIAGVAVILYGVFAAFGIRGFIGDNLCSRFAGSLGNPAYTGTYLIFALFYAAYLIIIEQRHRLFKKIILGFLITAFLVFLLLTQTRGAFLGLGIGVLAGLSYLLFKFSSIRLRVIIGSLIVFAVIGGASAVVFRKSINLMPFCAGNGGQGSQILDLSVSADSFQTRLALWEQSIKIFKERPILGWGPENFAPAFEKHYDPFFKVWYDRAHNIFFDYLVFSGVMGLLSFISIFVVYYWQFFKQKSLVVGRGSLVSNALLFTLPIAYLIQGLVLFDVLPIYINLFLFLAFSNFIFNQKYESID